MLQEVGAAMDFVKGEILTASYCVKGVRDEE